MSEAELTKLRASIDALDVQLIQLLKLRLDYVEQAGQYKSAHDLPALDETRWEQATEARLKKARELGLSAEFITELYELIHKYTLQMERDLGAK